MRHTITLLILVFSASIFAQNNVVKTAGVSYTAGAPTFTPGRTGSQVSIDTVTGYWYEYNGTSWSASGYRVQTISGCAAPAYTPAKYQSRLVINACTAGQGGPELYYYTGSVWLQINEGQTYTAGPGIGIVNGVVSSTSARSPYNVASYGIYPDGSDITANLRALYDTVYYSGGGTIQFNAGTYLQLGKIVPRTDYAGTPPPAAPDMIMQGVAGFNTGLYKAPAGGTIIDCRYSSDTIGVYQFRATGKTEIRDITFVKGASNSTTTPFIHTTFRTLHIHDCAFLGFSSASRCPGIVLGGDIAHEGVTPSDTTSTNGFQGYGTVIESNFFNFINTVVRFKTYANANIFSNNNIWNGCGGVAAITLTPAASNASGNVIENNLIEMGSYQYGILIGRASGNSIVNNNFFDVSGTTKANVRVLSGVYNNLFVSGQKGGIVDDLYDPYGVTTHITPFNGDTCVIPTYWKHTSASEVLMDQKGETIYNGDDKMYAKVKETSPWGWQFYFSHDAAAVSPIIGFYDYGGNFREISFIVGSSGTGRLASEGNLRVYAKSGGELYLGPADNVNHLFYGGALYGGLTATTTTFKSGLGDLISWSDGSNPLAGTGASLTSSTVNIVRTLNAAGTDGRHQALEFYATGTGANQLPTGTLAQRPISPAAGMIRFCTDCTANDASTGVMQTYNGTTWKNNW